MKFKEIKDLIFSECCIIHGVHKKYNVDLKTCNDFDNLEVIGIRSKDNKWGSYIIITCK